MTQVLETEAKVSQETVAFRQKGKNKDVPLELRLMIRNVEAFRELSKRYGVN